VSFSSLVAVFYAKYSNGDVIQDLSCLQRERHASTSKACATRAAARHVRGGRQVTLASGTHVTSPRMSHLHSE
jgi:hypothetical protein